MSPDPQTTAGILNWLLGVFREKTWYRFGVLLSSSTLVLSLFIPTIGMSNSDVQWFSVFGLAYFFVEWAQWRPFIDGYDRKTYYRRSGSSGFLLAKYFVALGFAYPIWSPWIELFSGSPFSSLLGLFATAVFVIISVTFGVTLNWTIIKSLDDFETVKVLWGIFSCIVFLLMALWFLGHIWIEGLSFIALVSVSCSCGLSATPIVLLGMFFDDAS